MPFRLISSFFVLCYIAYGTELSAQDFWMHKETPHLKYEVQSEGFYRISISDLWDNGMDTSVKGDRIYLYSQGVSVPLFVSNRSDLNTGDYIVFYGAPTDGTLDKLLAADSIELLNPYHNLVDSKSYYYLTWGTEANSDIFDKVSVQTEDEYIDPVIVQDKVVFNEFLNKPISQGSQELRYSHLDHGEGYGSKLFTTKSIDISFAKTDIENLKFRMRLSGNSSEHTMEFVWNGEVLDEFQSEGPMVLDTIVSIPSSSVLPSNRIELNTKGGAGDRMTLAFLEWEYNIAYNGQFDHFYTPGEQSAGSVQVEGLNTDVGGLAFDMEDQLIISTPSSNKIYLPSDEKHQIRILRTIDDAIVLQPVDKVEATSIRDFSDTDYLILSTKKLGEKGIEAYREYRESLEGGSFNVEVVYSEDLIDEFGFGNEKHFIGMHRFGSYLCQNAPILKHIFIIGKGVEYPFVEKVGDEDVFVPTFGFPASDRLLFSDVGNHISCAAVGRLAARNSKDVEVYLDKIRANEAVSQNAAWTKRIIHLSGGDAGIQDLLFRWLGQMEKIVENETSFGGEVTTYRKRSADPIQQDVANEIVQRIDNGAAMLTFFGHSAVGTFDFNLENASRYQNYGRLPLILSLGCFSGNIYTENFGLSEQFLLEPQNGAIGFLASSSTAVIQPQYFLGLLFYRYAGEEMYGATVGEIFQRIFKERTLFSDAEFVSLDEQFIIHGDPAMRMHPKEGPDYTIDFESVAINPSPLEVNEDFFEVSYQVRNLGKATTDSVEVNLKHFDAVNKLVYESNDTILSPKFGDTITTIIPMDGNNLVGQNRLEIEIDPRNSLVEYPLETAEENNVLISENREIGVVFDIFDNGVTPIEPLDFSIVSTDNVTLKVAPINAFELHIGVQIELDTVISFDSPFIKKYITTDSTFGLIEWSPTFELEADQVYFWRTKLNEEEASAWETRSFTHLPNSESGWSQSHVDQYRKNSLEQIDGTGFNTLTFDTAGVFINIENKIFDNHPSNTGYEVNFETFAQSVNPWKFMDSGIAVVVGDRVTGRAWRNLGGDYGSVLYTEDASDLVFAFNTDNQESRSNLIDFLDTIPEGSYVLAFTILKSEDSDLVTDQWDRDKEVLGTNIYEAFEKMGAERIRGLQEKGSVPYTLVLRKGQELLLEDIAQVKTDELSSQVFLPLLADEGVMRSVRIGPAENWTSLEHVSRKELTDETTFRLFALDRDGQRFLLDENVTRKHVNLSIEADIFPYLQLEYMASDSSERTFPDFQYWRCRYDPIADIELKSDVHFVQNVNEDSIYIETALGTNSAETIEFLEIEWEVIEDGNTLELRTDTIIDWNPSELYYVSFKTSRNGGKDQKINLRINPDRTFEELSYKNNLGSMVARRSYEILPNAFDVYTDNRILENGALVGKSPLIEIRVEGSAGILKNLTAFDFDVQLVYPSGKTETMSPLSSNITYNPQGENEGDFPIYSIGNLVLEPGDYMLKIEMKSGERVKFDERYREFEFTVTDVVGIEDVYVYPNPTSDFIYLKYNAFNVLPNSIEFELFDLHGRRILYTPSSEIVIAGGEIDKALEISLRTQGNFPCTAGSYPYRITINDVPYEGQLIFQH